MKRIFLLLAIVGITAFQSCSSDDDVVVTDNDTVGLVFDINRTFSSNGEIVFPFEANEVFSGDVVLIYWMEGTTANGNPIWRLIPQDFYFPNNEYPGITGYLKYNYDFDTTQTIIYADTDINLASIPTFSRNQIFRIFVAPGSNPIQAKNANANIDYKDYDAVAKAYGIKESNVIKR